MTTSNGGPAFPVHGDVLWQGMDLRDYFAAKALEGMMGSRDPRSPRFHPEDDAAYVYAVATAMLKAREM